MTPFTVRATRHTPHALRVVSGKGDSFPCSFSLPFSARKNGRDLTLVSLFICPAVQLRVLFARQHASTPHAQSEPDQSTTCTQRQAHAEMMTHHSLQNVLVAGGYPPFLPGRKASIPRPSFYLCFVSRLASLLLSWVYRFCAFCRMSSLFPGCQWCSQVTRTIVSTCLSFFPWSDRLL